MLLFSSIASLNKKLLAYSFETDSGLYDTVVKTGQGRPDIMEWPGIIISACLGLLGVIFLGLIVYGGINWLTAEGDEAKVEKAKKILTQSTMGLGIVLAAYAISIFVINAISNQAVK